jgi:AraC-like DNA-binding protein
LVKKKEDNMAKHVIEALSGSKIYQDYERAFSEATGLPIALRPVESWQLPLHGKRFENPFCALMAQKSRACAACLQVQQRLSESAGHEPQTVTCPAGLCDIAIPVRMGEQLIGFLITGQVFCKKPTQAQFNRTAKLLADWGVQTNADELREAYFDTRVLSSRQHESVVKLLSIFAEHLSMVSNQIVMQEQNAEPPIITRAKQFIAEHQTEEISLEQVAKSVHTSKFYFCKMFKKATGINFTDYLSRVRTERAKNLLLNQNLRISEIAYEVGFQSLTHFNRVFKRILGQSPTDYRGQLAKV